MQVVVLLLLVASLALLVSGLITGGTPLVVASIVTSLLAAYAISRYRNRQPATSAERGRPAAGSADRLAGVPVVSAAAADGAAGKPAAAPTVAAPEPGAGTAAAGTAAAGTAAAGTAGVGTAVAGTAVAGTAATGSAATATTQAPAAEPGGSAKPASVADSEPVEQAEGVSVGRHSEEASRSVEPDEPDGDEPPIAETDPPLRSRGGEPVWVIDGRPRYHLDSCGFLVGRESEPVPLQQAVEDGFTPCALCDPDSGLVAATPNQG